MRKENLTSKEKCYQEELEQNSEIAVWLMNITTKIEQLNKAISNGDVEMVKERIELLIDVTINDIYAIQSAAENGHEGIVKLLIEAGADVTANDNCAIQCAAENGYEGIVKLLIEAGADVTADDNYAIQMAAFNGYEGIVKLLIEAGVDPTEVLINAIQKGKTETVQLLINAGAITVLKDYILKNVYVKIITC